MRVSQAAAIALMVILSIVVEEVFSAGDNETKSLAQRRKRGRKREGGRKVAGRRRKGKGGKKGKKGDKKDNKKGKKGGAGGKGRKRGKGRNRGRNGNRRRGNRGNRGNRGGNVQTTQAPNLCPPAPSVANAMRTSLNEASPIVTAMYTCNSGYTGGGNAMCSKATGIWMNTPSCRCLPPPPVANTNSMSPQVSSTGSAATYMCLPNFSITNGGGATSSSATCISGMWRNVPTCTASASCGSPPTIANAVSSLSGSMATYTCSSGYSLRSGTPSTIVCTNNMWPTSSLPVCDKVVNTTTTSANTCSNVPGGDLTITRPAIVAASYPVGGSVDFTCKMGYRIVGSNNNSNRTAKIFCGTSGNWSTTPTCERVMCGTPPTGTNTNALTMVMQTYESKVTYSCIANYQFTGNMESTCQADGTWSLNPAPTCTQRICLASVLPALNFSNKAVQNYNVGDVVTYTCYGDYRIAPTTPMTTTQNQTVTCQADGTFTALAYTCVYKYPTDCKDYYNRDNMFNTASVGCVNVTVDPQGPGLETGNPNAFQAMCCKESSTLCCTKVLPDTGAALNAATLACAADTSTILPGWTVDKNSKICGSPTAVGYPISEAQIVSMINSTSGTCTQAVTRTCSASKADTLAIQLYNDNFATIYYGVGSVTTDFTDYVHVGGVCDCARAATPTCTTGCKCTTNADKTETDVVTKALSASNPQFVKGYQFLSHDASGNGNGNTVAVGAIQCCETYTA